MQLRINLIGFFKSQWRFEESNLLMNELLLKKNESLVERNNCGKTIHLFHNMLTYSHFSQWQWQPGEEPIERLIPLGARIGVNGGDNLWEMYRLNLYFILISRYILYSLTVRPVRERCQSQRFSISTAARAKRQDHGSQWDRLYNFLPDNPWFFFWSSSSSSSLWFISNLIFLTPQVCFWEFSARVSTLNTELFPKGTFKLNYTLLRWTFACESCVNSGLFHRPRLLEKKISCRASGLEL